MAVSLGGDGRKSCTDLARSTWPSLAYLTMSAEGICTAKVTKWRCIRGVMLKDPAVGFMQAQYCVLVTSFKMILICRAHHAVSQCWSC